MITVITGTPGAGKTLYAISKLLRGLVGQTIEHEVDGVKVQVPRTIYTNINGLLIDHELIDGGDKQGLRDWHKWAKPGSIICFDEVQRIWTPRPNGAPVSADISMLETHRHMGVDFILITQNVMLLDRNIQALGGRHLHVRRIANAKLAIVYEWDHISRQLLYAKAVAKSAWRYDKSVFKLYKSAELHTKQPRSLPGAVWAIGLAMCAMLYFAPAVYGRIQDRIAGGGADAATVAARKAAGQPVAGSPVRPASAPYPVALVAPMGPAAPASSAAAPGQPGQVRYSGCVAFKGVCKCLDTVGELVPKPPEVCQATVGADRPAKLADIPPSLVEYLPPPPPSREWAGWATPPRPTGTSLADAVAAFR